MSVRKAMPADASRISILVNKSAALVRSDLDDQGSVLVDGANTTVEFSKRLLNPEYSIFCFEFEQDLIGIISIYQSEKIDQLFVDPAYFMRGIARRLWERAYCESKIENENAYYWVRSSSMAVPVYEKFGFSKIGSTQIKNGIRHQFLELKADNSLS